MCNITSLLSAYYFRLIFGSMYWWPYLVSYFRKYLLANALFITKYFCLLANKWPTKIRIYDVLCQFKTKSGCSGEVLFLLNSVLAYLYVHSNTKIALFKEKKKQSKTKKCWMHLYRLYVPFTCSILAHTYTNSTHRHSQTVNTNAGNYRLWIVQ